MFNVIKSLFNSLKKWSGALEAVLKFIKVVVSSETVNKTGNKVWNTCQVWKPMIGGVINLCIAWPMLDYMSIVVLWLNRSKKFD